MNIITIRQPIIVRQSNITFLCFSSWARLSVFESSISVDSSLTWIKFYEKWNVFAITENVHCDFFQLGNIVGQTIN